MPTALSGALTSEPSYRDLTILCLAASTALRLCMCGSAAMWSTRAETSALDWLTTTAGVSTPWKK